MAFEDINGWLFRTQKADYQEKLKKCNLDVITGNGVKQSPTKEQLLK